MHTSDPTKDQRKMETKLDLLLDEMQRENVFVEETQTVIEEGSTSI